MDKSRYLVRKLIQAFPKSAVECKESQHSTYHDAYNEFCLSMFCAHSHCFVSLEICEIGDDDLYHPVLAVKLNWYD